MYDVGPYTIAPIKVVWRRMDRRINGAVIDESQDVFLGRRPVIPQETCAFVEAPTLPEAHYLCSLLNSSVANFIVQSHSVCGGKGFGTPSMLDFLPIKRFEAGNADHEELSALSGKAHRLARLNRNVAGVQSSIDALAARVFGVPAADLRAISALDPR